MYDQVQSLVVCSVRPCYLCVWCTTMLFVYYHIFYFFLCYAFQVTEKFYELTGIRHNITSAYHPQANGEVERFNRTTQEAFLKCTEFSDKVKGADVDWHRKLKSMLFAYRVRKQAVSWSYTKQFNSSHTFR